MLTKREVDKRHLRTAFKVNGRFKPYTRRTQFHGRPRGVRRRNVYPRVLRLKNTFYDDVTILVDIPLSLLLNDICFFVVLNTYSFVDNNPFGHFPIELKSIRLVNRLYNLRRGYVVYSCSDIKLRNCVKNKIMCVFINICTRIGTSEVIVLFTARRSNVLRG